MAIPSSPTESGPRVAVGEELLGRVIDGSGCALDGRPAHGARQRRPLDNWLLWRWSGCPFASRWAAAFAPSTAF